MALSKNIYYTRIIIFLIVISFFSFFMAVQSIDAEENHEQEVQTLETIKDTEHRFQPNFQIITIEMITEEVEIDFNTITKEDDTLPKGMKIIEQQGKKGKKQITYEVTYVNFEETEREVIAEVILEQPVDEIIKIGTKEDEVNEPIDKTQLAETLQVVKNYEFFSKELVGDSYTTFQLAIDEAKEVYERESSSQVEVDNAINNLEQAMHLFETSVEMKLLEIVTESIPYHTIMKEDPTLEKGKQIIEQAGKQGKKTIHYEEFYVNWELVARKKVFEETTESVDEVIIIGTKEVEPDDDVVDKNYLKERIEQAENYAFTTPDKVSDLYESFQQAFAEAIFIFENESATQEEVDKAANNLEDAMEHVENYFSSRRLVREAEQIEFETIIREDHTLEKGVEIIDTKGEFGQYVYWYWLYFIDDEEIVRKLFSQSIIEPIVEVIIVGTKETPGEPGEDDETPGEPGDGKEEPSEPSEPGEDDETPGEPGDGKEEPSEPSEPGEDYETPGDPGDSEDEPSEPSEPEEDDETPGEPGDSEEEPKEPRTIDVKLGEKQTVGANDTVVVEGLNVKIQMPEDLPEGTTISVQDASGSDEEMNAAEQGQLRIAGDIVDITFELPDGETINGTFVLTMHYDSDNYNKDEVWIYYFNEETGVWERQDSTAHDDGTITLEVEHFSKYGVFAEGYDETDGEPQEPKEPANPSEPTDEEEQGEKYTETLEPEPEKDEEKSEDKAGSISTENGKPIVTVETVTDDTSTKGSIGKLPKTATNVFNILAVGIALIVLGGIAFVVVRRRKVS